MANQSMKIIITAPYFGSAFQIAILEHFKKLIRPENMSFRSSTVELNKQIETLKKILTENKPTVLIAISMSPNAEIVSLYKSNNVPIILLDEEVPGTSTLATDNYLGGRLATDHLISKSKKKIAIVNGRARTEGIYAGNYCARLRLDGYKDALKKNGLSIPPGGNIEVPNYSRDDGVAAMPKLISAGVDGIFCAAADNTALGLLAAAKEHGVKVPDDIAIVGFDDLPIAQLSTPSLTTVRQPMNEIVEAAFRLATDQREEIIKSPKKILFKPELIVRKST
jgi:DNA-binding LacI/PurR family transcriptional regulator